MTAQFYLKSANGKSLPVELTAHNGQITMRFIGTQRIVKLALQGDLPALAAELRAAVLPAPARFDGWDWLTPEYVIEYFEQSPVLSEIAPDVRSVLAPQTRHSPVSAPSRLELDIQAVEHLCAPTKADIAQVLLGKRSYGGAAYERITAVYEAVTTTTTPQKATSARGRNNEAA